MDEAREHADKVERGEIDSGEAPPRVRMRRLPGVSLIALLAFLNLGFTFFLAGSAEEREARAVARAPRLAPGAAGAAETLVEAAVRREFFPGAAYAIGRGARVERLGAAGRVAWGDTFAAASARATRYDLASLTKVVATTAAVMALVEDGKMRLDDPVTRYLPEFAEGDARVTVRMLLAHTGGVRAGAATPADAPAAEVLRRLVALPTTLAPGEDVLYSDVGFIALFAAAERAAGEPLESYLRRRVWGPLGMDRTGFGVETGCGDCAPTLLLKDGEPYAGGSYDLTARRLDGVAGNAGLFSTAEDLSRFAAMIANGGSLGGVRVFRPRTVRAFTRPQPGAGTRTLGWEVYCREGKVPDHRACGDAYAFGHSGVTGTSLWIDPDSRAWVVLLANRVYQPRVDEDDLDMQSFRRLLFDVAAGERSATLGAANDAE